MFAQSANSARTVFQTTSSDVSMPSGFTKTYVDVYKADETITANDYRGQDIGYYSALEDGDSLIIEPATGGDDFNIRRSDDTYTLYCGGTLEVEDIESDQYGDSSLFRDEDTATINGEEIFFGGVGGNPPPPICFVAGTRVLTTKGYVNIEELNIGDTIIDRFNEKIKIKKVFRVPVFGQIPLVDFYPNSICKNMPEKLTTCVAQHGIILPKSGIPIQAQKLVNGKTIVEYINKIEYIYNLELEDPSKCYIANGLYSESLDTSYLELFNNHLSNKYGNKITHKEKKNALRQRFRRWKIMKKRKQR